MAVKPEIIKARLKALFPKANLSQKRIDAYAAKLAPKPADDADETAIDAIITDYNDVIDFEAVAKEDDSTRTLLAKAKADADKAKGGKADIEEEEDEEIEVDKDAPAWAKALIKQNQKLSSDLESIKSGNVTQTKKATAFDLFDKSETLKGMKPELAERWKNRLNVDSETPIDEQIKELETEYSDLVQVNANDNHYAPAAGGGNPTGLKADQSVVDKMLESI